MPSMTRRTFLWLTGGTGAAIAADPSRKLVNKLIPRIVPPEHLEPGEWASFATTCRECPAGCGMHLWHRDGRVTKAEGNPDHPLNRGGLCPRGQASLQGLYDPDRLKWVLGRQRDGKPERRSWEEALAAIGGKLKGGAGVAVMASLQTGALAEVMQRFTAAFGSRRLLWYEPFHYEPLKNAHRELFGLSAVPTHRLDDCDYILSFAADFLETWLSPVEYASRFGQLRDRQAAGKGARLIYVGPRLSMTAANADDFIQVPPGGERLVALALVAIIIDRGWARHDLGFLRPAIDRVLAAAGPLPGLHEERLAALARAFVDAPLSVALAGPVGATGSLATETALAVALLNHVAGRTGRTVDPSLPHALTSAAPEAEIDSFLASLGPEDILFVVEANPCYTRAGSDSRLSSAGTVVYLGTLPDETAMAADWVLPLHYPLESWGDYDPAPGVHGIMQPTMSPLHDTRASGDIFLELARRAGRPLARTDGQPPVTDLPGWLRARWEEHRRKYAPESPWESFWTGVLRRGGLWTGSERSQPPPARPQAAALLIPRPPLSATDPEEVRLWPWASIMLHDGRLANRGWLQEAADPVTAIAWGNWIDIHPQKASLLKLKDGDVVELATEAGKITVPVRLTADIDPGTAALAFGHGHEAMGKIAAEIGANAFRLLGGSAEGSMFASARLKKGGGKRRYDPTLTSPTLHQHGREILRWTPPSATAGVAAAEREEPVSPLPEGYRPDRDLYPRREYLAHRWGMVIDLNRCIGCGACAVACYAENNIPVMGKKQVYRQREMAWLRVVPYRGEGQRSRHAWLPMLCQHCDAAPCEPVCPVFAAVHNEEGLNAQVYNRCIGTRYCSNNCPYKVRRFNWLNTTWRPPLDLQLNPEVTVRSRGVMEKCTFCIQRIRQAEYRAKLENRKVRDGEVQPACVQSCPTRVYTFGDLLDPEAAVTRLTRTDPRRYQVLGELNTKPAITYLKRVEV